MAQLEIEASEKIGLIKVLHISYDRSKTETDLNLIDFSSKHLYKSIADFHKTSGDLHDIDDLYNYLNNYLNL